MNGIATLQRLGRALREGEETCLALLDELGHSPDAFLDRHVRIDARHAKDVERLDAEILQALLAGLPQITRIAAAAHGVSAAVAWTAALRMNHHVMPAAADRLADQAMIVAFPVTGRRVEKIDAEIERAANRSDRLGVVDRSIGARHAVAAVTDRRHREIGIAESASFHK